MFIGRQQRVHAAAGKNSWGLCWGLCLGLCVPIQSTELVRLGPGVEYASHTTSHPSTDLVSQASERRRRHYTAPPYITSALPSTRRHDISRTLRNASTLSLPPNSTTLFQRSFILATTRDWNKLPESLRSTPSPRSFKREVLRRLGVPTPPAYYSLGTKIGNILHTKLRVGMSDLNAHQYTIQRTTTPICSCSNAPETTAHFIIHCRLHTPSRLKLTTALTHTLHFDFSNLPHDTQMRTLLHGTHLSTGERSGVARLFQQFLFETKRFV